MLNAALKAFVEEQIALAGGILADAKVSKRDYMAGGKLSVLLSLHRFSQGKATAQDLGMFDAINDSLQKLGILNKDETFLNYEKRTGTVRLVKDDDDFNRKWAEVSPLVLLEFSKPGVNEQGEPDNSARTGTILDELAPEFEGKVVMFRVPLDTCTATAQKYNVTAAPTVIFFKNGAEPKKADDFHLKFWFRKEINELLGVK